jgi:hypothetical protein
LKTLDTVVLLGNSLFVRPGDSKGWKQTKGSLVFSLAIEFFYFLNPAQLTVLQLWGKPQLHFEIPGVKSQS